jgi:hypothetical protein
MSADSMRKPNRDDDDIPPEIDFRRGIRGKYAERYRAGVTIRELPPLDPIAFYETQSRLGHALWHAQALEGAIVAYLSLVDEMPIPAAREHALALLGYGTAHGVEHLGSVLRPSESLGVAVLERLQRFLTDRNWLVHRSRFELETQLGSPSGPSRSHDAARRPR